MSRAHPITDPVQFGRVAVLLGGTSSEREVSLDSGRNVLEALRQPMEEGHVTIARVRGTLCLPARFQLVAAMNPCPCGWLGAPSALGRACRCTAEAVARFRPAIVLYRGTTNLQLNLAVALRITGKFAEAERWAPPPRGSAATRGRKPCSIMRSRRDGAPA